MRPSALRSDFLFHSPLVPLTMTRASCKKNYVAFSPATCIQTPELESTGSFLVEGINMSTMVHDT